jgi:hypothetical protein
MILIPLVSLEYQAIGARLILDLKGLNPLHLYPQQADSRDNVPEFGVSMRNLQIVSSPSLHAI